MARFAALLTASGAGDRGASLAALGGGDVASLGAGGIDELTRDWPTSGQSPGCSTAAVAAARNGGGWWMVVVVVRGKMRRSQCVTRVTFQPRLLDLATRGRLLLINGNYH
jgi:hypothetical protein